MLLRLTTQNYIPLLVECQSADHSTATNVTTRSTARSDTTPTDFGDQKQQGDTMININIGI